MNKLYLFSGIGIVAVILIVVALSGPTVAVMNLDQILASKDCTALDKWSDEHIYDENLNLSN